jgi:hypothetical protein
MHMLKLVQQKRLSWSFMLMWSFKAWRIATDRCMATWWQSRWEHACTIAIRLLERY